MINIRHGTARPGFSMVEVLMVIAVLGMIAAVSIPMLRKFQIRSDLLNASETITQGIARARLLAQSGNENSAWGFSIQHGVLFKGESYDARDTSYDEHFPLPATIEVSGTTEVYFDPLTGKPNAPGSIVTLSGNDGLERIVDLELTVGGFVVAQNDLISVCTQPGTPSQKLILIHDAELQSYLAQGATQGLCPVLSSSSSSAASSPSSSSSGVSSAASSSSVSSAGGGATSSSSSSAVPPAIATKGIFVLQASSSAALSLYGNAILTSNNGSIRVNSNHASAVTLSDNAKAYASHLYVTGSPGVQKSGNAIVTWEAHPGSPAAADPLASLPVPSQYSPQLSTVKASGNAVITLAADRTYESITVSGNAKLTLSPGSYYLNKGLSVSGNGKLYGDNVFIYNASGNLTFSGNAIVQLTPPDEGTYAGVLFFNNRTATSGFTISGNGNLSLQGAVYCPNATFTFSGNGINNNVGSLMIMRRIQMSDNAKLTVQ